MPIAGTARVTGVEVLRRGIFNGREFTNDDLDKMVSNYDTEHHRAKITFDHAAGGGAHFGYVSALSRGGEKVYADLENVPIWIANEMLEDGAWADRSAQIYFDLDGKGLYLTHLSLLGVKMPAVRGMDRVTENQITEAKGDSDVTPGLTFAKFAEDSEPEYCNFEMIAPEEKPKELSIQLEEDNMPDKKTGLTEDQKDALILELQANEENRQKEEAVKLAEADQSKDALIIELQEKEAKRTAEDFIALELADRVTPGMKKAGLAEALMLAAKVDDKVELADGTSVSLYDVLTATLKAMPKLPDDQEIASLEDDDGGGKPPVVGELDAAFGNTEEDHKKYGGEQ